MTKRATIIRERVLNIQTTSDRIKKISECEARVLAMLIDYKGRIHGARTTEKNIKVPYRKPEVEVTMNNILPVICASVWCGRFGVIGKNRRRLPIWAIGSSYIWEIGTEEETRQLLQKIQQYMQERKEQATKALEMLTILKKKQRGFEKETERLTEELSKLNDQQLPNSPGSLKKRLDNAKECLEKTRDQQKSKAIEVILKWFEAEMEAPSLVKEARANDSNITQ